MTIWYFLSGLGITYQEKSGNPGGGAKNREVCRRCCPKTVCTDSVNNELTGSFSTLQQNNRLAQLTPEGGWGSIIIKK
jgi:hypothetical protein